MDTMELLFERRTPQQRTLVGRYAHVWSRMQLSVAYHLLLFPCLPEMSTGGTGILYSS